MLICVPTCAVARACVGFAFPQRSAADVDKLLTRMASEALAKWSEEVPESPQAPTRIVHLGIDTSNSPCPTPCIPESGELADGRIVLVGDPASSIKDKY